MTRHGRNRWRWAWSGLTVLLCSGCALDQSSMQMNSTSKMPWFNFSLAPAKKDTGNYQRSINRGHQQSADRLHVQPATPPAQREIRWAEWLSPQAARTSQPLPVTEPLPVPRLNSLSSSSLELVEFD